MRMEGSEDILKAAQKRKAGRKPPSDTRPPFPAEHMLRIDNFTVGGMNTPSVSLSPSRHIPKGFIAEVANERRKAARVPVPMFLEEVPYSRNLLPPLLPVQVLGREVAALLHTACHISLISNQLVNTLGLRHEVILDSSVPPSPLSAQGPNSQWLVEGKLRYVELSFNGSKHVTQLHVGRDLPSDLVLGVDFLKKVQMKINFQESIATLPKGGSEIRLPFLSNKEMTTHRQLTSNSDSILGSNRAYSSNF